jgi:uncharacterized FlaG/YvyC family protein
MGGARSPSRPSAWRRRYGKGEEVNPMAIDMINGNIRNDLQGVGYPHGKAALRPGRGKNAYIEKDASEIEGNADGKVIINEAIERLKSAGDLFNRRIDLRVDEETNRVVVKVIDTKTDKVIKEIPPEQILHLAAKIQEMIGLLVDEER